MGVVQGFVRYVQCLLPSILTDLLWIALHSKMDHKEDGNYQVQLSTTLLQVRPLCTQPMAYFKHDEQIEAVFLLLFLVLMVQARVLVASAQSGLRQPAVRVERY